MWMFFLVKLTLQSRLSLWLYSFFISKVLQYLGNLPAVWDSFDELDIQQSLLTARTEELRVGH